MALIPKDISAPLDDDQLSEISAGLAFSGEEQWPAYEYFRCPYCAGCDFNVIGSLPDNPSLLEVECVTCARRCKLDTKTGYAIGC